MEGRRNRKGMGNRECRRNGEGMRNREGMGSFHFILRILTKSI
jgi:hypothetical protein